MKRYFILFFSTVFVFATQNPLSHIIDALPCGGSVVIDRVAGGQTNQNYKATVGSKTYFIKTSHSDNKLLGASLEMEWMCTSIVAAAGIAPRVISYQPQEGIMVSEFIESQKVDLRIPEALKRYAALVRSLHNLDVKFSSIFCPFKCIQELAKNAKSVKADLPERLTKILLPKVSELQKVFPIAKRLVPCHLDLHQGNVLDTGDRMWLIDWEYAAMADPMFDLATVASADYFTKEEMYNFLQAYLEREPSAEESAYFKEMRFLSDIRWALWCYIQAATVGPQDFFQAYGDTFLVLY